MFILCQGRLAEALVRFLSDVLTAKKGRPAALAHVMN